MYFMKEKLAILFIMLLCITNGSAYAQKRVTSKSFITGKITEDFTVNSVGDKHGIYKAYDSNGILRLKLNYVNGVKQGWAEIYLLRNGTSQLWKKAFFITTGGGRSFITPNFDYFTPNVSLAGQVSHFIQYYYQDGKRNILEEYCYDETSRNRIFHQKVDEDGNPLVILNRKKGELNFQYSENLKEFTIYTDNKGAALDTCPTYNARNFKLIRRMYVNKDSKRTHYIFTDSTKIGDKSILTKYTDKEILKENNYKWKIKGFNSEGSIVDDLEYDQITHIHSDFKEYTYYNRKFYRLEDEIEHSYQKSNNTILIKKNGIVLKEYFIKPQRERNNSSFDKIIIEKDSLFFRNNILGKIVKLNTFDEQGVLIETQIEESDYSSEVDLSKYEKAHSFYHNNDREALIEMGKVIKKNTTSFNDLTFIKNKQQLEKLYHSDLFNEIISETSNGKLLFDKFSSSENELLQNLYISSQTPLMWTYRYQNKEKSDITLKFKTSLRITSFESVICGFDKDYNLSKIIIHKPDEHPIILENDKILLFHDYINLIYTVMNDYEKILSYKVEKKYLDSIVTSYFGNNYNSFQKELIKCFPKNERATIKDKLETIYSKIHVTEIENYSIAFDAFVELKNIIDKASELNTKFKFI